MKDTDKILKFFELCNWNEIFVSYSNSMVIVTMECES